MLPNDVPLDVLTIAGDRAYSSVLSGAEPAWQAVCRFGQEVIVALQIAPAQVDLPSACAYPPPAMMETEPAVGATDDDDRLGDRPVNEAVVDPVPSFGDLLWDLINTWIGAPRPAPSCSGRSWRWCWSLPLPGPSRGGWKGGWRAHRWRAMRPASIALAAVGTWPFSPSAAPLAALATLGAAIWWFERKRRPVRASGEHGAAVVVMAGLPPAPELAAATLSARRSSPTAGWCCYRCSS